MMAGIVFDIQNYAIYDGPGIRTCVYFKGCPLTCSWCHNPESQKPAPEMAYWEERCASCGTCIEVCPCEALSMENGKVVRDKTVCVACGKCAEECPNQAMERIGAKRMAEEIIEEVLRDRPFFEESGGGVTITGGEPTMQPEFLFELLDGMREKGVHTAIETSGFFPKEMADKLAEKTDLFLYDIKHPDPDRHREGVGADNRTILDNFRSLLDKAGQERVVPRIPLIPGFNTDETAVSGFIAFLEESGYKGEVHLMPYHDWCRGKYERLGRGQEFEDRERLSEEKLDEIASLFQDGGFETCIHG